MSETDSMSPMLSTLKRRRRLDDEDEAAVLALRHELYSLEAGETVVREGDPTRRCCLIRSGFAYRHKMAGDGGRQIVAIQMAGEMVDLQNSMLLTADHSVEALTAIEIAFIDRRDILELARTRPTVGEAMWLDTLVDGSIFREWIANIGRRDARTRVAHLLCEFALRQEVAGLGERGNYILPMNQEQLGDALGLTPVHVNRMLRLLEQDELIARSKREIRISSWNDLKAAADFDPTYLHLDLPG